MILWKGVCLDQLYNHDTVQEDSVKPIAAQMMCGFLPRATNVGQKPFLNFELIPKFTLSLYIIFLVLLGVVRLGTWNG